MSQDCNYRIRSIDLEDHRGSVIPLYRLKSRQHEKDTNLQFWKPFRVRVEYECTSNGMSEFSFGAGFALTSAETMEHVMYFNTNRPHSDDEFLDYDSAQFRQFRGRCGIVEAYIPCLQAKPGRYLMTVVIVPNHPGEHEIHDVHHLEYPIVIEGDWSISAAFYPRVRITYSSQKTAD